MTAPGRNKGLLPADDLDLHIAAQLRARRRALYLFSEELAVALGVDAAYFARLESGAEPISAETLAVLADLLDVPVSYFFSGYQAPFEEEPVLIRTALMAAGMTFAATAASAEVAEITFARLPNFPFLPLVVMEGEKLVQKHAAAAGLGEIKVSYMPMNMSTLVSDALVTGRAQFAGSGLVPFLILWDRTRGDMGVKAVGALSTTPFYLISREPRIQTIKDFRQADRISVVVPKISTQSILLEMEAARVFGEKSYAALDGMMIGMPNSDAAMALLSGSNTNTADFNNPPFTYKELASPGAHVVLSSEEVLGGPATNNVLFTTDKFAKENPQIVAAVRAALAEAIDLIKHDRKWASEVFLRVTQTQPDEALQQMIYDPKIAFGHEPHRVAQYGRFMQTIGMIASAPQSWQDVFLPQVTAGLQGD